MRRKLGIFDGQIAKKILHIFFSVGIVLGSVCAANAAGYTCSSQKKYTSCAPGYYISNCGTAESGWIGQTIATTALKAGNSCIKGTNTSYAYAGGLVCPELSLVKCAAGTYLPKNSTECAECPSGHYCDGGDFTPNAPSDQGISACPTAELGASTQRTTFPDEYYPYSSAAGGVDKTTAPTIGAFSLVNWTKGLRSISECTALYSMQNAGGQFNASGVGYNTTTKKYDVGGVVYYSSAKPGYYLDTRYSDTYCDTASNNMFYKKAVVCPEGSYCAGGSVPKCSSGTYETQWGKTGTCPTNWTSAAGASAQSECYRMITLNKNGGSGNIGNAAGTAAAQQKCFYGLACTFPSATGLSYTGESMILEKWAFNGWGTATTCTSGTNTFTITSTNASVTYYACRQQQTDITFDLNGGTGTKPTDKVADKGKAMPFLGVSSNPTRTGYDFQGWYDKTNYADSAAKQYYTATRASARNWDKTSATATLYAGWKAKTYTCSAGYYLNVTECTECLAGYYCPASDQTYTYNGAIQGRTACPAAASDVGNIGTWSVSTAHPDGASAGATSVSHCLALGVPYTNVNNGSGLRRCFYTSGTDGNAVYSTDCQMLRPTSCNAGARPMKDGTYTNATDTDGVVCTLCPAGKYKSAAGMTDCTGTCPTNWTSAAGASAQTQCYRMITLDKNGGSGTITVTTAAGASASATGSVAGSHRCYYNTACALPSVANLTYAHHTYTGGWGTDAACTDASGTAPKITATTATVTYYACNTPNVYAITLDDNGGSGGNGVVYQRYGDGWSLTNFGDPVSALSALPTKTDSVFNGYYTAQTGGTQRIPADGSLPGYTTFTANTTLFAQYSACAACTKGTGVASCNLSVQNNACTYSATCSAGYKIPTCTAAGACSCTANTYKVAFDLNGGAGTKPSTITCTYGTSCALPAQDGITKANSVVGGWNASANGQGTNYDAGSSVSTLTTTDNATVTLYAKWTQCASCDTLTGGNSANCSVSVANNQCVYTTSCKGNYYNLTGAGTRQPSCSACPANSTTPDGNTASGCVCDTGHSVGGTSSGATSTSGSQCSPITYGISYTLNDGTQATSGVPATYTYGTGATVNGVPTRSGYVFSGWCTDSNLASCSMSQTIAANAMGDKTFYAKWTQATCSATKGTASLKSVTDNKPVCTITCSTGYSKTGGTNTTTSFDVTGNAGAASASGTCSARTFTVTYACGTGTTGSAPSAATATYDANFTPAQNTSCAKVGYTFAGWNDGTSDRAAGTAFKWTYAANQTFTARWTPITFNVAYANGGGTGNAPTAPVTCTYDGTCDAPANTYTRSGYTFKNWKCTASSGNCASATYAAGDSISTAISVDGATITLTADWDLVTYSITYNLNGGTNSSDNPATYNVTTNTITLQNPTRANSTFGGWYTSSALTGTAVTQIAKGSTGNKTFYAKWTCNTGYTTSGNACVARTDLTCAAGQYLDGVDCKDCASGNYCPAESKTYTYNGGIQGRSECPTAYAASDAKATSINKCYLTTTSTKYVAKAGEGQVTCAAGGACAGGTKVYYNGTGGRTSCASPNYAPAGASACSKCSDLSGISISGTYSSVSPFNAKTTCRFTADDKTITGCATVTSNTVSYSVTAWNTPTYAVTANGGYIIKNNNTANATCMACDDGTYSTGGTVTSCSLCSALTPAVAVTGGTYASVAPRDASSTCRYKAPTPTVPEYCATKVSNIVSYNGTAWGTDIYSVTANAGAIISNNNSASATCSQCGAGKYSGGGTATSCDTCAAPYSSSAAGSAVRNDCYLTTTATKYVAKAGEGQVTCAENSFCGGGTNVYYGGTVTGRVTTGGSKTCSDETGGKYTKSAAGASAVGQCYLTLTAGHQVSSAGNGASTCAAGKYCNSTDNIYFKADAGTATYLGTSCPAGTYSTGGATNSACTTALSGYTATVCSDNQYSDAGASACTACATDKGYKNSGSTAASHAGIASCKAECTGSQYVATAGAGCVTVGGGYYGRSAAKTAVAQNATLARTQCPAGYRNGAATTLEANCAMNVDGGKFVKVAKESTASGVCAAGTAIGAHVVTYGNTSSCDTCAAGSYTSTTGQSECTICPAGNYCTGGSNVTKCAAGTYRTETGGTAKESCANCPALDSGYAYAATTGMTAATSCTATKSYSAVSNYCYGGALTKVAQNATTWKTATSTLTAKAGAYLSGSGDALTCVQCTGATYQTNDGSNVTSCSNCPTATSTAWTLGTGTGWTLVTQCNQTRKPDNCAGGRIRQNATSDSAWGGSVVDSALSANSGYYVSGVACPACSAIANTNGFYPNSADANTGGVSACYTNSISGAYVAKNASKSTACDTGMYKGTHTVNYGSSSTCVACTNKPANSTYTGNATTNACAWACNDGYNQTSANICAQLCTAGITELKMAGGFAMPLYTSKQTSHAIAVRYNDAVCYGSLADGRGTGALNVSVDGTMYHTIK